MNFLQMRIPGSFHSGSVIYSDDDIEAKKPTLRYKYMKKQILIYLAFFITVNITAKPGDSLQIKTYRIKPSIDIPLTFFTGATYFWGANLVSGKSPLDSVALAKLDPVNVNRFDRSATRQNAGYAHTAKNISDIGMYGSFALPLILLADRNIRNDFSDVFLLYLETEALTGNLFTWGGNIITNRIRPLSYNPGMPYADRLLSKNKNSFFSGHTSSSAAASFFVAKVYCDYHPELGNKKYIIYSLAVLPPAFTGFFRYKGMKHFPSDILVGFAVGAGTGILVPAFHKNKKSKLVFVPVTGTYNGFAFSLKF